MKQNQAHLYSHCSTDGARGNSFPALPQCPSLGMERAVGSWRRGPTCFSGECESSSSIVRLQTCLDTSMDMGMWSVGGICSGVLWVCGSGAVSGSPCVCVSVCVPMMYTFTRSATQLCFESWWYENNMRLCCMSNPCC